MKPLNLDNRPCSPISSNCVIWQGPDIACINLCKGDTISDVVAKLATELCDILDQLDVTNYDLTCFGITNCGPANFEALIKLLIDKICELQSIPTDTTKTGECPDCVVTVASCFIQNGQTTMQLVDYVQMIAQKVCGLIDDINNLQLQIDALTIRVEILENTPPPVVPIPTVTVSCTGIGTLVPGTPYPVDVALQAFFNSVWCQMSGVLGTPTELLNAIAIPCEYGSDVTSNPNWTATPTTLAESITNIWIVLCELYNSQAAITVTDTTTVNLTYTGGVLQAEVQDTGWINLLGFAYMSTNAARPQCRRIGNEIHFRGYITVPMGNAEEGASGNINIANDSDAYVSLKYGKTYNTVASGSANDSCQLIGYNLGTWTSGPAIGLRFNKGNSVIPPGILNAGQNLDAGYTMGTRNIIYRTVRTVGNKNAALHTLVSITIDNTGKLIIGGPLFDEVYTSATAGYEYSGIARHVVSNIIEDQYVPTFIAPSPSNYNAPNPAPASTLAYNAEVLSINDRWAFSQNCGHADEWGGFMIRLDGLKAFISPCDTTIPTPTPCV